MRAESLRLTLSQHCRQGIGELVPRHAHVDESFHRGAGAPRGEARDGVQTVPRAGGDASCEHKKKKTRNRGEGGGGGGRRGRGRGRGARGGRGAGGGGRGGY